MKSVFALLISAVLLAGCVNIGADSTPTLKALTQVPDTATPVAPTIGATISPTLESGSPTKWWQDAIFYEIYVRSFYDSNGDGIGDLQGVIQKLDYLNDGDPATSTDLGVNAIWLMPIMPSPSVHGYDVTDYYAVNPAYGTMEDLKELLNQVHKRGMHLIIDLPQNHTSSEHPWFIASQDPASPYRDWYVWADNDPGYLGPWNRVVWHPLNGDFFYGYFWEGMPDLNYTNPAVTEEMYKVTRFWLQDVGIDGFRLDAIGVLIAEGEVQSETPSTHRWFQEYYRFYKGLNPSAFTVGEIWMPNKVVVPYVANQEVDMAFNFDLAFAILQGINERNPSIITGQVTRARDMFPGGRYGVFVTNHDMDRIMTQLGNDQQKAMAAASIYLTLPGVPFIFYGEEIGMGGTPQADHIRYPMQWTGESGAGFTPGTPWLPPLQSYPTYNVAVEGAQPASLLTHYQKLIALRNTYPVLRHGVVLANSTNWPELYSTMSVLDGQAALVVVNLSDQPVADFNLSQAGSDLPAGEYQVTGVFGSASTSGLSVDAAGGFTGFEPGEEIPAWGTLIYLFDK